MRESKGSEEGAQTGNIFEGNLKGERVQRKGREGESQEGDCLLLHSLLKKLGK